MFGIIATLFLVTPLYVGAEAENFTEGADETLLSEVLDENIDTDEIVVEAHKDVANIIALDERNTTIYLAYLTDIQKPTQEDAEMLRSSVNHLMENYLLTARTEVGNKDAEDRKIDFVKQAINSSNYDEDVRTEILNTIADKQVSIEEARSSLKKAHIVEMIQVYAICLISAVILVASLASIMGRRVRQNICTTFTE